jgi:hypothetical protein
MLVRAVRRTAKRGAWLAWQAPLHGARVLPDFLIIGTQRAGTTSLYRYLATHPAVRPVPLNKGVHFFDVNYQRGLGWYRAHFPTEWTMARVERRTGLRCLTGEASPYYAFHPLAPERIARTLPGVKMILLLRDPVERAYSHHRHETARGFEDLPFEDAIESEEQRLGGEEERLRVDPSYRSFHHQHHSYLARGRYLEQIIRYHAHFPREQLLILVMEEFFADPARGYARVLRFLGLPPHQPRAFPRYNARRYEPMDPRTRRRLERYFRPWNRDLATYLGIDLPWGD